MKIFTMKTLTLIALLFLFGCSEQEYIYNVDPMLREYVDQFYTDAEAHGVKLSKFNLIVKGSTDIGVNSGMCTYHNDQRVANIAQYIIDSGNKERLKIVVYHELGHALLWRNHIDNRKSIMNTSACINCPIDSYYLNELFKFNVVKREAASGHW